MSAQLYTATILRLATSIPHHVRLSNPMASAERRSPICGSRVTVDLNMAEGRVSELGLDVSACAFGQAAASLMAQNAIGKTADDLEIARGALADYLVGERDDPGNWPGLDAFAQARQHSARHAAIRLAFEAVANAARAAEG